MDNKRQQDNPDLLDMRNITNFQEIIDTESYRLPTSSDPGRINPDVIDQDPQAQNRNPDLIQADSVTNFHVWVAQQSLLLPLTQEPESVGRGRSESIDRPDPITKEISDLYTALGRMPDMEETKMSLRLGQIPYDDETLSAAWAREERRHQPAGQSREENLTPDDGSYAMPRQPSQPSNNLDNGRGLR